MNKFPKNSTIDSLAVLHTAEPEGKFTIAGHPSQAAGQLQQQSFGPFSRRGTGGTNPGRTSAADNDIPDLTLIDFFLKEHFNVPD